MFGQAITDDFIKEMQQLNDKKVIKLTKAAILTHKERKGALGYLMSSRKKGYIKI